MNYSLHQRLSDRLSDRLGDRLKGAVLLAAIVFGILFLAGGPAPTAADADAFYPPSVTGRGNPSWDF